MRTKCLKERSAKINDREDWWPRKFMTEKIYVLKVLSKKANQMHLTNNSSLVTYHCFEHFNKVSHCYWCIWLYLVKVILAIYLAKMICFEAENEVGLFCLSKLSEDKLILTKSRGSRLLLTSSTWDMTVLNMATIWRQGFSTYQPSDPMYGGFRSSVLTLIGLFWFLMCPSMI